MTKDQKASQFYVLRDSCLGDEGLVSFVVINAFSSLAYCTSKSYKAILLSFDAAVLLRDLLMRNCVDSFYEIVPFSDITS